MTVDKILTALRDVVTALRNFFYIHEDKRKQGYSWAEEALKSGG